MERPLLLLDIDGVLNPWGTEACPEGFCEYNLFPGDEEPVRLAVVHGQWLAELGAVFEPVWASAWGFDAHRVLGPILGLTPFAYVPMPEIPFPAAEKVPAIAAYVEDRAMAWIDDMMVPEAHAWAESRGAPTLLVEADHRIGMTREHVEQLLAWAQDLSRARRTSRRVGPLR